MQSVKAAELSAPVLLPKSRNKTRPMEYLAEAEVTICENCPLKKELGDIDFEFYLEGYLSDGRADCVVSTPLEFNPLVYGGRSGEAKFSATAESIEEIEQAFQDCAGPVLKTRKILPDKFACGAISSLSSRAMKEGSAKN